MTDPEVVHYIKAKPSDLLLDCEVSEDIARLMLGLNAIASLHRALFATMHEEYVQQHGVHAAMGDKIVLLAKIVGTLKEAADQFRQVAPFLIRLAEKADRQAAMEIKSLSTKLDKEDPRSQYNSLLRRIRDDVGFHWKRTKVSAALAKYPHSETILSHSRTRAGNTSFRFDLMDAVVCEVMMEGFTKEKARDVVVRVRGLSEEFMSVGLSMVSLYLTDKGYTFGPSNTVANDQAADLS